MQFKKTLLSTIILLFFFIKFFGQTTYLPFGDQQEMFLNRLDIKLQNDSVLKFSKIKPFSREAFVPQLVKIYENKSVQLSKQDKFLMRSMMQNNIEWVPEDMRKDFKSKKSLWNTFYEYPADLYSAHTKDFDISISPMLNFGVSKEGDNDQKLFTNSRGLMIRGKIANRVGFHASITDNQERTPKYVQEYMFERSAVPGAAYYKEFKDAGGVDYFDARGYFTFGVTKHIDVAFGYDKSFIGNGYRSLFLSDNSAPNTFIKLNTRIGRFNYQNLFMELTNAYARGGDKLLGKKFAAMHHLDIDVAKGLNIGFFEGVVFGRTNHVELGYFNPIIFLRALERDNGSPDNAVAGMDFKANIIKRVQLYGQLLLDEFQFKEIKSNKGWWANKFGYQLGAKYIDALGIQNLDVQAELNRVRPFTYTHYDSVANYTHYNQALAHPLMANFNEVIGILRYRPIPKLMIEGKAIYYMQGRDSIATTDPSITYNYGSNIFLSSNTKSKGDYGYKVGDGWKTDVALASLLLSYELKSNLFIDANLIIRKQKTTTTPITSKSATIFNLGIRYNMGRRVFDF